MNTETVSMNTTYKNGREFGSVFPNLGAATCDMKNAKDNPSVLSIYLYDCSGDLVGSAENF